MGECGQAKRGQGYQPQRTKRNRTVSRKLRMDSFLQTCVVGSFKQRKSRSRRAVLVLPLGCWRFMAAVRAASWHIAAYVRSISGNSLLHHVEGKNDGKMRRKMEKRKDLRSRCPGYIDRAGFYSSRSVYWKLVHSGLEEDVDNSIRLLQLGRFVWD